MAAPSEKLAKSLDILHRLQERGVVAIRSAELTRTHRERLVKNGFLKEVLKGWYIPSRPDEVTGESTSWYASFWKFCVEYLNHVKGEDWILSPEQSVSLSVENFTVPGQLLVRASKATNNVTVLPFDTSILDIRSTLPNNEDVIVKNGLRLYALPAALVTCSPVFFRRNSTDARAALAMVSDASGILERLLDGGHSVVAGRLAGAFRNIGRDKIADEIVQTMKTAGYTVRETDPFEEQSPLVFTTRALSPCVNRIRLMWQSMREVVIEIFPIASGMTGDVNVYLKQMEDVYVNDAYHSLSIEGYRVSRDLIERVRSGDWDPGNSKNDKEQRDALAARGYWQAHEAVKESIRKILQGENPGAVAEQDLRNWYRELFAPGVTASIIRARDLAGYRNNPVFIRRSMHVPPSAEAVRGAMPVFFELLTEENDPGVRAVLGHFIFVYIHPFMDGNGRVARFLMNAMLASGGYSWTVIPLEQRNAYMAALENASVGQDIRQFTQFIARLVVAP